jgi:hypothetical protein
MWNICKIHLLFCVVFQFLIFVIVCFFVLNSCKSMIAWEAHIYIYIYILCMHRFDLHHILHKIIKQINDNSLKWISNIYIWTILYHEIWSADMHGK